MKDNRKCRVCGLGIGDKCSANNCDFPENLLPQEEQKKPTLFNSTPGFPSMSTGSSNEDIIDNIHCDTKVEVIQQEKTAIEFAKWIQENGWEYCPANDDWIKFIDDTWVGKLSSELYSDFIKVKSLWDSKE